MWEEEVVERGEAFGFEAVEEVEGGRAWGRVVCGEGEGEGEMDEEFVGV